MMHATSVEEFAHAQRSTHIPIFVLVVALVAFVRIYFGTGRIWLGVTVCALRLFALIINFAFPPSLNFREITALRHVQFLGQTVSLPVGVSSPWTFLGELDSLLLLIFVIDASINLWRQGNSEGRRRAVIVGGSITFFILLAAGVTALIHRHFLDLPYLVSFPFAAILVAMSFELSSDLLRAGQTKERLLTREKALREFEERVTLAAEVAHFGVWEMNIETREIWMSDGARRLFQFGPGVPVTHEAYQARVHPDDRALREAAVKQAIQTGSYDIEYRALLPDATVRWIAGRGRSVKDTRGKLTRLIGVSADISARKAAEAEARLQRNRIDLLGRVSLLGEMTASLAHELDQPLSAIVNNSSAGMLFIDKGKADLSTFREILVDVAEDALRAQRIVHNVRNTIKKGKAIRERINLNDVVNAVAHMVGPDAAASFCEVKMSLAKDLPAIEGDPVQIQQVLINLLRNALDSVREVPITDRKVEVVTERNGDGTVLVSVRDYGVGIPVEVEERLFDQFFTTKKEGLGMGLAIVKSIIEAYGGKITAENAKGAGARFRFTLPTCSP